MPLLPLKNLWIQKYHQNKSKFNGVYWINNLPEIKDRAHAINLDEYKSIGTHWVTLYVKANNKVYFDSFGVGHVPKKFKKPWEAKIQYQISIEYRHAIRQFFWTDFIDFMLKDKSLVDYTNLFSPHDYENNEKIIQIYFQWLKRWKNILHYLQ